MTCPPTTLHGQVTGSAADTAGALTGTVTMFRGFEMDTYILLGCGFGLALLIAMWGIWNLR
jgi:hypothetical protein